jgi:hypothetical protein
MLKTNTFLPAIRPWLSEVQSVRRLHRQRAGHLPPHLISRPVTRPTHPALQRLQVHADECGAMEVGNCTQLLLALLLDRLFVRDWYNAQRLFGSGSCFVVQDSRLLRLLLRLMCA